MFERFNLLKRQKTLQLPFVPKQEMELMVTLLPSFPHFAKFARDSRLAGIRLNSAMLSNFDLDKELALIPKGVRVPLYFDVKGRQLRITKVNPDPDFLDFELNHPVRVQLPTPILFKGGEDSALLVRVHDGEKWYGQAGHPLPPDKLFQRLAVQLGPKYVVHAGESIHIRDASLQVGGNQFVPAELQKIEQVKKFGLVRWFLSYVESQRDVDQFLELVGPHAEVVLKIESKKGMEYVAREFKKRDNIRLCAAKGDLYVELDMPHDILRAQKLIIENDPKAIAGSRMMLSVINKVPRIDVDELMKICEKYLIIEPIMEDGMAMARQLHVATDHKFFEREVSLKALKHSMEINEVPSDADFEQLAWLYEIGYRSFMLCDELCLHDNLLSVATSALNAFKQNYK